MLIDEIPQVDPELVKGVEWVDDHNSYDKLLCNLGITVDGNKFLILNPHAREEDIKNLYYLEKYPSSHKCVVFKFSDTWLAKIFTKNWTPDVGYYEVEVQKPTFYWKKNQFLDRLMTFKDDPFGSFEPEPWDKNYELIWYIDPKVNPLKDKVWAVSCTPLGVKIKGTKDMGYLMPDIDVEVNEKLPDLNLNLNELYPPYYELDYESAWKLHSQYDINEHWVVKFKPNYRNPKGWRWLGEVGPNFSIEYNPDLGELNYDLDYIIPLHDLKYRHVWYLDPKHLQNGEKDIWAFKIGIKRTRQQEKNLGYISPSIEYSVNEDLPDFNFDVNSAIPWYDLKYKNVWYLDQKFAPGQDKIWAVSAVATDKVQGEKDVGILTPLIPDRLDVIFISYHEPNAEENWQRCLKKAPYAKRVDGVKGIFNAHKAAAKMSSTDMFYVVDGDAWLVDDWNFDYQPGIFDRDCAYVWHSRNPVNDLEYGYGGVKLFSKAMMLSAKSMIKLDMTTSVMPKLKVMEKISNETRFNVDEFSTWRSAFRECVKLYVTNQQTKLDAWLKVGEDKPFGKYSTLGATDAINFAKSNINNFKMLLKINDRVWLETQFKNTKL